MTEQDRERSESGDALERVLQILKEIAEKSADGDYLYRGEPKHYCRVSSSLYRECAGIDAEHFDIEVVQREVLETAKEFIGQIDDCELLTQLQHYGYSTNLIDFTTSYLIALFFACDGKPRRNGRVILLKKSYKSLLKPSSPANRVIAQKSIFVRPPKGIVEPDKVISIPRDLKEPILHYLRKCHDTRPATIYNDLHGFIKYSGVHRSAYLEFYAGLTNQDRGEYGKAIERYSNALALNPQLPAVYNNRGNARGNSGDIDNAIRDFDKAIELAPNSGEIFNNRGNAYSDQGEYDRAIQPTSTRQLHSIPTTPQPITTGQCLHEEGRSGPCNSKLR